MPKADKTANVDREVSKADKEAFKADEKRRKQLERDKAKVSWGTHSQGPQLIQF
jgi:hypothetical protein